MSCKGICGKYKVNKKFYTGRYVSGQKRCTTCGIYIEWDGVFCPCCGVQMRHKPRNSNNRKRLQEITMVKRI